VPDKKATLYSGEVDVYFQDEDHVYTVVDRADGGQPFHPASVTGILKMSAKPALIQWAANMACAHVEKNWKPGKSYDELEIKKVLKEAKYAHRTKADSGKEFGTLGHRYMEAFVRSQMEFGTEPPELPTHLEARLACEQMTAWLDENVEEYVACEALIYSRKLRIASTLDLMARFKNGGLTLSDYKYTSGVYPEYRYQLSAYAHIWKECMGGDLPAQRIVPLWEKKSTRLIPTVLSPDSIEADFEAFCGFIAPFRRQQELQQDGN
jgi:hypothetical protein